jgi:hypothetical protein
MNAKTSRTTSWDVVLSPLWMQQKRWIPMASIVFSKVPKLFATKQSFNIASHDVFTNLFLIVPETPLMIL